MRKKNKSQGKFSQDNNYNRFWNMQAADINENKAAEESRIWQKDLIKGPNEVGCCLFFKEK